MTPFRSSHARAVVLVAALGATAAFRLPRPPVHEHAAARGPSHGSTITPDTAAAPTGDVHDFDFHVGEWTAVQRRLKRRWTTTPEWETFPSRANFASYLGGTASVSEVVFPTKGYSGLTLRTFDPTRRQWSIYWVTSRGGELGSPMVGGFQGNVGTFYGADVDEGRPVRVRAIRTKRPPDGERWEQAFSRDSGGTWETNWTAEFTRVRSAGRATSRVLPAAEPELFGADVLSTRENELNSAFTPDGRTVYFTRTAGAGNSLGVIHVSHMRRDGHWDAPTVASFSGRYADFDPFVSPDGKRLFFISKRPAPGAASDEARSDFDIWVVDRTAGDWGVPQRLTAVNGPTDELYPSVAADGTLYFSSCGRSDSRGRCDLYRSRISNGQYLAPENLGDSVNTAASETDVYVAPDQSYLVFAAYGRADALGDGDLYVSEARGAAWSAPRRLGTGVNTVAREYCPLVSPDGRYLYFTSQRGFTDGAQHRRLTTREFGDSIRSVRNGFGNLYRIPISALGDMFPSAERSH